VEYLAAGRAATLGLVGVFIGAAAATEVAELADVAARTFPLACPPSSSAQDIAAFIDANLSVTRFAEYLDDPDRVVLGARLDGRIVGYAMLIRGVLDDADVQRAVTVRPSVELSKMYVLPEGHGGGAAGALMDASLAQASGVGGRSVWLGVNQKNQRAQRFYTKHGFKITGTKTFRVGEQLEQDYVMVRGL
jgi:ribosomal protein S18 acetylase RimI-like enzyme